MQLIRNIYRSIYRHCPSPMRGWLTRAAIRMPGKPSVKACNIPMARRFPEGQRAALVLSADFEMGWAWRYSKRGENPDAMGELERRNVPLLLKLFEDYSIPVTWATVGHLFLDRCERVDGRAHPELRRIPHFSNRVWSYEQGDWYDHDPCLDTASAPAWYAPDLIRMVADSPVGHEIGCHSFSHLDCTDERCPEPVFEDEIKECVRLAETSGHTLRSMVFPGGTNGNYAVLKRHGFTNYRINSSWDLFYPERDEFGLWRLPSTASIDNHGFGWSGHTYRSYYGVYLEKALRTGTLCHLWFHPSVDSFCLREIFPPLLEYCRKLADRGDLWITTMADMAAHCEAKARS